MDRKQAKIRIDKLKREIERHRYLYHVLDKTEISEAALDSLKHELVRLETEFPQFLMSDSPSQRVAGKVLKQFSKVKHSKPVFSLQDFFSPTELSEWQNRIEKIVKQKIKGYYCELKLDGLTVVLTYENGMLVRGATRGDGVVGEDVTNNLRTVESIPLQLNIAGWKNIPKVIEVRGEVVISKKRFALINQKQKKNGQSEFANPRNLAAGSVRQLDPAVTTERRLDCFAFELITDCGQKTHAETHEILARLGFKTSKLNEKAGNLSEVKTFLTRWEKKRKSWDYNTDGAVIVVNDTVQERALGSVGKSERWMAAYKFPAEQTTTIVKDIIIQVGRTGALTPIAVLEPVLVAGTTVSRATLHNADEIERLDVRVGDTVIIQKAGDIIPDIVQVLPKLRPAKSRAFVFPQKCPICRQSVIRPAKEVAYYCTNKQCFARQIQGLIHFVSKKALNIDGLGDKIVEQLMQAGLVTKAADFFSLRQTDLESLPRFGSKSAENIIKAIAQAKKQPLSRLIYALGIRHVGEETARQLADHFGSLAKLEQGSLQQFQSVPDIGPVVAESLWNWFQTPSHRESLQALQKVLIVEKSKPVTNQKLHGKTFVITGTLSQPREEMATQIRQLGGKVATSVSSQTDYLVAGDDPGSKLIKAQNLGVKILDEASLAKLLG